MAKWLRLGESQARALENAENYGGVFVKWGGEIVNVNTIPLCDVHVAYHGRWLANDHVCHKFLYEYDIDLTAVSNIGLPVIYGMELNILGRTWSISAALEARLEEFSEALWASTT